MKLAQFELDAVLERERITTKLEIAKALRRAGIEELEAIEGGDAKTLLRFSVAARADVWEIAKVFEPVKTFLHTNGANGFLADAKPEYTEKERRGKWTAREVSAFHVRTNHGRYSSALKFEARLETETDALPVFVEIEFPAVEVERMKYASGGFVDTVYGNIICFAADKTLAEILNLSANYKVAEKQ